VRARDDAAGFSLLEVLLAILVLGLALVAFFGAVGEGVAVVTAAREYETARSLMHQVDVREPLDLEDLERGEFSGRFDGEFRDYRWRRTVEPVGKEEDEFYRVETVIEWGDARNPGEERVETYLHAPSARREGWVKEAAPD
jgi:prepilin-type N-terminal cleavage/methylation domain-containing protein